MNTRRNLVKYLIDNFPFQFLSFFSQNEIILLSKNFPSTSKACDAIIIWREMMKAIANNSTKIEISSTPLETPNSENLKPNSLSDELIRKEKVKKQEINISTQVIERPKTAVLNAHKVLRNNNSNKIIDNSQWIKRPHFVVNKPLKILENEINEKDLKELTQCILSWKNEIELIFSGIEKMIPDSNPLSEVKYWRDVSRILGELNEECKIEYVAITLDLVINIGDKQDKGLAKQIKELIKRVNQGAREASVNYKYLQILEEPLKNLNENGIDNFMVSIKPICNTMKQIYEMSIFYKESRLTSFNEKLCK